ncbi:hypothetical protein ABZ297_14720 [Nonomuraea sp. NPDC005983]|uniref:hypothetical protein n=1 Tax=Nonomuraea sp. NPDC005983 TaxID=3155595 RepID=UPI0033AA5A7D
MPTSSSEPPKLTIPKHFRAVGPGQMHVYNPKGKVARTITFGQRADPGFFKNVIAQMKRYDGPITLGLSLSGVGWAGWAIKAAVVANVGNPFLFSNQRDTWREIHGHLKGSAWDVWLTYFNDVSPNWKGHAVETLQQYLRFKLIGMFDQLGNISKELSGTMHNQYKEVLEYDMAAFGMWTINGPIFKALSKLSAHPAGRVALMTQTGVFLTMAGTLLKQFVDIYRTNEGELNSLQLKVMDLKGAFYNGGDPANGARDLHVDKDVANPAYWEIVTEEKS